MAMEFSGVASGNSGAGVSATAGPSTSAAPLAPRGVLPQASNGSDAPASSSIPILSSPAKDLAPPNRLPPVMRPGQLPPISTPPMNPGAISSPGGDGPRVASAGVIAHNPLDREVLNAYSTGSPGP